MSITMKRAGLITAIAGLVGAGACSSKSSPLDDALKSDLAAAGATAPGIELAPNASKSQVVVSAIEGGPTAAPRKAAPVRAPRPSPKATARVAQRQEVQAPAPAPEPVREPAPAREEPVMQAPHPAPAPVQAPQQDRRVYKTEGEIFRQMPWIRP